MATVSRRRGRVVVMAAALSLTTITGMAVARGASTSTAPNRPVVADPSTVAGAAALARHDDAPVVVTSMTTPTDQTLANPDGTVTLQTSDEPVRALVGSTWLPVDPTLVQAADGSWGPRVAAAAIKFSDGGSGSTLASINSDGTSFTLGWPFALPAPTVSGSTATYANVLPGVDLQLTATAESFSEVLIVQSEAAAEQAALKTVRFVTSSSQPPVSDGAGGFRIPDQFGMAALTSPMAAMWDSSVTSAGTSPAQARFTRRAAAGSQADSSAGDPSDSDEPDSGKEVALPDSVSDDAVTLTPSQALLTSPTTDYPVYIDPTVNAGRAAWAMVDKAYPTTSYYKWTDSDQGDGYNDVSGIHTKRLFYEFATSVVAGQKITAATLTATEDFSYDCSKTEIDAYLVGTSGYASGSLSSAVTWNAQPGISTVEATAVPLGVRNPAPNANCSVNAQPTLWNVLPAVSDAASAKANYTTFGLYAHNETVDVNWHRFTAGATLSITYDRAPSTPSNVRTATPSTTCVTGTGRPIINVANPLLSAVVSDPDAGNVGVNFQILITGTSTVVWSYNTPTNMFKASGSTFNVQAPSLTSGKNYSYHAMGTDGTLTSGWSTWCEFGLDTTKPAYPTITPSPQPLNGAQYPTFIITYTSTSSDVKYFYTSIDNDNYAIHLTASASSATYTWTPDSFGPHTIYGESVDSAGNISSPKFQTVTVDAPTSSVTPAHMWEFDEGTGSTTADQGSPGANPLTLSNVSYAMGRDIASCPSDYAMQVNGTSSQAVTSSGSVIDTTGNFVLTALVYLPDTFSPTANLTAVSLNDGGTSNVFTLGYGAHTGSWQFAWVDSTGVLHYAGDVNDPQTDAWVHLGVVWDASLQQATLYVNGDAVDSQTTGGAAMKASTSNLYIGRSDVAGAAGQFWAAPGAIDDVEIFDGTFDEDSNSNSAEMMQLADQLHCAPPPPGN